MKHLLKEVGFSLGSAFVLTQMQLLFGSQYVVRFLEQNLILLLVALLAINCTTLGIVLTKIRELSDGATDAEGFGRTRRAMMMSIYEQIVLVGVSLVLLLIHDSTWLRGHCEFIYPTEVLVVSCFIYALLILYDTAKSVFVILEYKG